MKINPFSLFLILFLTLLLVRPAYAWGPEQEALMKAISEWDVSHIQGESPEQTIELRKKKQEDALAKVTSILNGPKFNWNEKREAEIDLMQTNGWNPLCLASVLGAAEIVRDLLAHGASLEVEIQINDQKASPLILAAQYERREVLEELLAKFKPRDYQREIEAARNLKQPDFMEHLFVASSMSTEQVQASIQASSDAQCESAPTLFPNDQIARMRKDLFGTCAICTQLIGNEGRTQLVNGAYHSGDSVLTLCGHCYCKDCIDPWIESKAECPICKQPISKNSNRVRPNKIPEFAWIGPNKVPIPGHSLAQAASVPPVVPAVPLPVQNQSPIRALNLVQGRVVGMHQIFHLEGDPENVVWTEPLRKVRHSVVDRLRGQAPTLTDEVDEMDYSTLMSKDRGCFALNPVGAGRDAIWAAVNRAIQEETRWGTGTLDPQARGCYPALKTDLVHFRAARGWHNRHIGPQDYRSPSQDNPPTMPNMNRWFRSASPFNAHRVWLFDGDNGEFENTSRFTRNAVLCRCVDPAG